MKTRILFATWAGLSLWLASAQAQMAISTVLTNGLAEPWGVVADSQGNIFLSDSVHQRIVRIDASTQAATTLAGLPDDPAGSNDGPAYAAHFNNPEGLVVVGGITNPAVITRLGSTNGLVVADSANHLIRFVRIDDGEVITLAGHTDGGIAIDGAGRDARFRYPAGLSQDDGGRVYIADWGNNKIRVLDMNDPDFSVTTVTISGGSSFTNLYRPVAVSFASLKAASTNQPNTNQLWIADTGNQMVKLVTLAGPANGNLTTYLGGYKSPGAVDSSFGPNARFNGPCGLIWSGKLLLISDTLNNTIRVATNYPAFGPTNYAVATFAGTGAAGLQDGVPLSARLNSPYTIVRDQANNGLLFTDLKNNALRRVQSGPPLSPVPTPRIGWVDFVVDAAGSRVSVLRTNQPAIFNNDVPICVEGTDGTQTHYTYAGTPEDVLNDTVPTPSVSVGNSPPKYHDGMYPSEVPNNTVIIQPDFTVKAIGYQEGRQISSVSSARYQFQTGSPFIQGLNAAAFTVSDITEGSVLYWATNVASTNLDQLKIRPNDPRLLWNGPETAPMDKKLVIGTNIDFFVYATRTRYATSQVSSTTFWISNYVANKLVFGFEAGEAASDFVASPGQSYCAPVTLAILPNTKICSLQFNMTVTNAGPNPGPAITNAPFAFSSFLVKPIDGIQGSYKRIPTGAYLGWVTNHVPETNWYITTNIVGGSVYYVTNMVVITNTVLDGPVNPPPDFRSFRYDGSWFLDLAFTNSQLNLLSVGWLERMGYAKLYDTIQQDLIRYSMPHDTVFDKTAGRVVLGGYTFLVPGTATAGQTYQIALSRPSATSDGVGGPEAGVHIETPTSGSLGRGLMNSVKHVVIGQAKYLVGDAAPFRWFNAGEFGNTNLDNSDVMQVFQSAIDELNLPPGSSDMFDSLDSCGRFGADWGEGFLRPADPMGTNDWNNMFNGDDLDINRVAFGDGKLNVCDVFVTFRRSLDPSLYWFRRFWTNGFRAAEIVFPQTKANLKPARTELKTTVLTEPPTASFTCGDMLAAPGQLVQVPVSAQVFGEFPLRVLMLNLTVSPLDGSPALDTPVQFTPIGALGTPTLVASKLTSYGASWLNSSAGLTGSNVLGYLTVRIPTNATAWSAYAIYFEHASGSPNGLAAFDSCKRTGLITLSSRSASAYGDNIPDSWRLRYFGTAYNLLSQAEADADGDGMTNWQEYLAGTDPMSSGSHLRLSPAGSGHSKGIHWPSMPGRRYIIERSQSLFNPGWLPVSTNLGTGADIEFTEPAAGSSGFYRVRLAQ